MKTNLLIITLIAFFMISCNDSVTDTKISLPIDSSIKISFIELGSDRCIPCQKMKPVLDSIRKKYSNQILVQFIDVIKNRKEAEPYHIEVMPTQVFLNKKNVEIYRHVGFFSEDSIHLFLQLQDLKIIN